MDIEKAIEFIVASQANAVVQMEELRESQRRTEATLRRAIRLAVREVRNERERRRSEDASLREKLEKLATAQIYTQELLETYLRSLRPGGNGGHLESR
jgi:hypothetical protein